MRTGARYSRPNRPITSRSVRRLKSWNTGTCAASASTPAASTPIRSPSSVSTGAVESPPTAVGMSATRLPTSQGTPIETAA